MVISVVISVISVVISVIPVISVNRLTLFARIVSVFKWFHSTTVSFINNLPYPMQAIQ